MTPILTTPKIYFCSQCGKRFVSAEIKDKFDPIFCSEECREKYKEGEEE